MIHTNMEHLVRGNLKVPSSNRSANLKHAVLGRLNAVSGPHIDAQILPCQYANFLIAYIYLVGMLMVSKIVEPDVLFNRDNVINMSQGYEPD